MSRPGRPDELLTLTQSFFHEHLQRTCGASAHTVRAYRDTLRLFFSSSHGPQDRRWQR